MSSADWDNLEKGLTQRLKALNAFLEDVYGEARIIRDGVIPADVVMGCPQYRTEMRGFSAPYGTWVVHMWHRFGADERRLESVGGQPSGAFGGFLHAGQPEGGQSQPEAAVPDFSGSGRRALWACVAGDVVGARAGWSHATRPSCF